MVWDQLSIDKPHLAYLIIGGFTSLFMLFSLFVKERLYIGEATVATICGVIFGPHAANLFNPLEWGNTDKITLELSRIVLVVQCFAVGVELPKAYMERHWRSVVFLLVPVMTVGWLLTSLFIWGLIRDLTWLESLCISACVTATDPVLASSVVGKGKFAKRVPKHLRDVLSAESGCNDGMAFPFIYLSVYLLTYHSEAKPVVFHWFCNTVLYECIFGAIFGFSVGYIARHAIKWADSKKIIDRESFLVFYFVLALFCAGSGSLLGMDDLLIGFAAGVGFSNDGWFTAKTEESHVSNVIDLLLNLAYFVYLGSILPWEQYNNADLGLNVWRLVVIAILVLLFRRIPIMLALKPFIPDVKIWREALFAGHFGPIGVGAVFAVILARAELETDSTEPLEVLPGPEHEHYYLIQLMWPIVSFLVLTSIVVHGSSIAVFTLGKRINTLTLTMSYTQGNDQSWMNRLPRIQSTSRSMSKGKSEFEGNDSSEEGLPQWPPGTLPPTGLPGNFLRRQREEDDPSTPGSGASSLRPAFRRRKQRHDKRAGGPISQSAIAPQRRNDEEVSSPRDEDYYDEKQPESPQSGDEDDEPDAIELEEEGNRKYDEKKRRHAHDDPTVEAFQEGDEMIVEDEEGNVISMEDTKGESPEDKRRHIRQDEEKLEHETSGEFAKDATHPHEKTEGEEVERNIAAAVEHPGELGKNFRKRMAEWNGFGKKKSAEPSKPKAEKPKSERKRGPAHAYQYGNTIIVEDEEGEVIKKYDLPKQPRRESTAPSLMRMNSWYPKGKDSKAPAASQGDKTDASAAVQEGFNAVMANDDQRVKNTVLTGTGRRMSKQDFIDQIQKLDPSARCRIVEESDVPQAVKDDARADLQAHRNQKQMQPAKTSSSKPEAPVTRRDRADGAKAQDKNPNPQLERTADEEDRPTGAQGLTLVDSDDEDIPVHDISGTINRYSARNKGETAAAQRRRRLASPPAISTSNSNGNSNSNSNSDNKAFESRSSLPSTRHDPMPKPNIQRTTSRLDDGETQAEKRRRLAALGQLEGVEDSDSSDSEDDGGIRQPKKGKKPVPEPRPKLLDDDDDDEEDDDDDEDEGEGANGGSRQTGGAMMSPNSERRIQWGAGVGGGTGDGGWRGRMKRK